MNLYEALETVRKKKGELKFRTSDITDPHIQQLLSLIEQHSPLKKDDIIALILMKQMKLKGELSTAPNLTSAALNNMVENEVFSIFCDLPIPVNGPKFSKMMFQKLIRIIKAEITEFRNMVSFLERKPLKNEIFLFDNSPLNFSGLKINPALNDKVEKSGARDEGDFQVPTAAATPSGHFYFNINFMQKLMDYAFLRQIKPKGKKYVCNGGQIPNEYAWVEFVLLHEWMHFTNSDFLYSHIIKDANHTILNYVGDFRSNYVLVKSGYEELPFGLFSDNINYDRQTSYEEMYELILNEVKQLQKKAKQQNQKKPIQVGDEVKTPDGTRGIVEDIKNGKATVRPV